MKQIEVQIMQQSYLLACPQGQELRLLEAVERVDTAMVRIRDAGKVRTRERIAVLAALNLAFEVADYESSLLAAAAAAQTRADTELGSLESLNTLNSLSSHSDADLERAWTLIRRLDAVLDDDGDMSSI